MRKIATFLQEAKTELAKVTWPTRNQVIHNTLIVIGVTLGMGVFLSGLDYGFSYVVKTFFIQ